MRSIQLNQPGAPSMSRSRTRGSGTFNPRSIEAAINTGQISPKQYRNLLDERFEKWEGYTNTIENSFSALVPITKEEREEIATYLRARIERVCERVVSNKASGGWFRISERIAARLAADESQAQQDG